MRKIGFDVDCRVAVQLDAGEAGGDGGGGGNCGYGVADDAQRVQAVERGQDGVGAHADAG